MTPFPLEISALLCYRATPHAAEIRIICYGPSCTLS